ncbi:hypothetical protein KW556_08655 [Aeromonas veronii]|uniref:hypothetical protein n=1 Tax=Aeromonas veronii TaxID=654 RepID=UPI00217DE41E|nr:hypothetical protein [Aeromonas veronii]UWH29727.1 hypothetical protein KW556_08655 [Aeromonas veronii]
MTDITITDTKEVWVVYTNTDLTEGRGHEYPIHVCGSPATAARMATRKGVQGSDANVSKEIAVKVRGSWLAPVSIIEPNDADRRADALNAERLRIMDKARAAGLTDDEIRMLGDI